MISVILKIFFLWLGIIYNDLIDMNLFLDMNFGEFKIFGLIDFGDICLLCYLFELVMVVVLFIKEDDVFVFSGYFIFGYEVVFFFIS